MRALVLKVQHPKAVRHGWELVFSSFVAIVVVDDELFGSMLTVTDFLAHLKQQLCYLLGYNYAYKILIRLALIIQWRRNAQSWHNLINYCKILKYSYKMSVMQPTLLLSWSAGCGWRSLAQHPLLIPDNIFKDIN